MTLGHRFARIWRALDERGAAATEFAFVMPVFTMMILGFLDLAHWSYLRSVTSGALEAAARSAGVGGAAVDPAVFEQEVADQVHRLVPTAELDWTRRSYYQFSGIGKPEKLTTDNNDNDQYDDGDCWEDLNSNNQYDIEPGRDGVGGADDILFYQVDVTYQPLIPLTRLLPFAPQQRSYTLSTIVKRQPFAAQSVPAIRC